MRRGVHTSCAIGNAKPSRITPTTVTCSVPSCTVLPSTAGSLPNRVCQTSYPITATEGAPGRSSASINTRPMSGVPSATRKAEGVISATCTGRASPFRHDQVARQVTPRPELRHGPQRAAPDVEVVQRAWLGTIRRDVPVADPHEAVALGQRQGRVHEDRQHLEDDRPDADRECHGQPGDHGEAWILHEHPPPELEVEREPIERAESSGPNVQKTWHVLVRCAGRGNVPRRLLPEGPEMRGAAPTSAALNPRCSRGSSGAETALPSRSRTRRGTGADKGGRRHEKASWPR